MIYDCFIFYMENDLLEIRLEELYDVVDKFVLVESKFTHSGLPKPLYFEQDKERFKKYLDKIEHIVVDNFYDCKCNWEREKKQRDAISEGLKNCNDDDVIIISDSDEIPRAKTILECKDRPGIKVLEQSQYNFFLNYINNKEKIWRRGPRVLFYKDFCGSADDVRYTQGELVENGGWHFTFLGGLKSIKNKIQNFSHQEYNNDYFLNDKRLKQLIYQGEDIFDRGYEYKIVNIDKTFPKYLRDNQNQKFGHLMLKKQNKFAQLVSNFNKFKNRKIDPYSGEDPINSFIGHNFRNITVISDEEVNINGKYNISFIKPNQISQLDGYEDDSIECIVLNKVLDFVDNEEYLFSTLKNKMNQNAYIIIIENNAKISGKYNRKELFNLFSKQGFYFAAFKGINPIKSFIFNLIDTISGYSLYDKKYRQYLFIAKS